MSEKEKLITYKNLENFNYSKTDYKYQPRLTAKLSNAPSRLADQELINEIVLWKVNRYAELDQETLDLLNSPLIKQNQLDKELTTKILTKLLSTPGVRLAMASTILRYRNPDVYQIIDQRAYRFAMGEELKIYEVKNNQKELNRQIGIYLSYLEKLREIARDTKWAFNELDQILYVKDKEHNKEEKIK